MLAERNIKQLIHQLAHGSPIKIPFDGSEITMQFIENGSKLSLNTLVYEGFDYIPPSVRQSLSHRLPASYARIPTTLTIDEETFQIKLHFIGSSEILTDLTALLEEFGYLAEKWRLYLNEKGKNDLIYVRVR